MSTQTYTVFCPRKKILCHNVDSIKAMVTILEYGGRIFDISPYTKTKAGHLVYRLWHSLNSVRNHIPRIAETNIKSKKSTYKLAVLDISRQVVKHHSYFFKGSVIPTEEAKKAAVKTKRRESKKKAKDVSKKTH